MKKLLTILLASLLVVGCTSSAPSTPETTAEPEAATLTAGTYTGVGPGFHGDVVVEVTVDETSIVSVEVVESVETRFISDNAIQQLPKDIVDNQSVAVDAYTGCTISSRAVLAAAKDALSQAGDISAFTVKAEAPAKTTETVDTDVVVVGGGIAGLAAAITAVENGATVTLVEKLDRVGGSTVEAGGILYATGSPVNKDVDNDVQALVDYWQMRAEGNADEDMLKIAAEGSSVTVEKLQEWGVKFSGTVNATGTSPALRAHYASDTEGGESLDATYFIEPLWKYANDLGINFLLGTRATELLTDGGEVTGVVASSDACDYTINAKSVVLATGGYDLSTDKMKEYSPDLAGTFAVSSAGNTGDGLDMAMAVGAATNFTGGVIGFKIIDVTKHYIEGSNLLGWLGLLGVTNEGTRFGNEAADYPIFCTELIDAKKAGAEKFFLIIDSSADLNVALAEEAVAKNLGKKADTLEDLAKEAGIDADNLVATVDAYNACVGGVDEFGKPVAAPVEAGPFYAVEIKQATLGTIGGLLLSENAEVLDEAGNAIPNLYAAGEVANSQFFYKEYPASGSSISISTTFGRIAGAQAAENSK